MRTCVLSSEPTFLKKVSTHVVHKSSCRLPHRHKISKYGKARHGNLVCTCNSRAGEAEIGRWIRAHWSFSLAFWASSKPMRDPVSKRWTDSATVSGKTQLLPWSAGTHHSEATDGSDTCSHRLPPSVGSAFRHTQDSLALGVSGSSSLLPTPLLPYPAPSHHTPISQGLKVLGMNEAL